VIKAYPQLRSSYSSRGNAAIVSDPLVLIGSYRSAPCAAPMAAAGSSRKINDLRADDGFNPVGHLKTGVLFDVAPNLN
jgi:hypothetical protein